MLALVAASEMTSRLAVRSELSSCQPNATTMSKFERAGIALGDPNSAKADRRNRSVALSGEIVIWRRLMARGFMPGRPGTSGRE